MLCLFFFLKHVIQHRVGSRHKLCKRWTHLLRPEWQHVEPQGFYGQVTSKFITMQQNSSAEGVKQLV